MIYVDDVSGYRAGACNIGPAEISRRRRAGLAGIAAAVTVGALMLIAGADPVLRWLVAIPLYGGIIGFAQAQLRFCAGYGFAGLRNFGPAGDPERVDDPVAARADRRRAMALAVGCGALTVVLTGLFVALPL
jgi:hypothetical protein